MARVQFYKVNNLPATLQPDTLYFVENGNFAETYVTDSTGAAKSIGNSGMINALIQEALSDFLVEVNAVEIVPDIAARDALIATIGRNAMILVIDASGDPTVDTGSALYAWDEENEQIYKIAEYESMDAVVQWSSIQGGPTSTPTQIDLAVSVAHSHSNKSVLDKISEGIDGLMFDGEPVGASWDSRDW